MPGPAPGGSTRTAAPAGRSRAASRSLPGAGALAAQAIQRGAARPRRPSRRDRPAGPRVATAPRPPRTPPARSPRPATARPRAGPPPLPRAATRRAAPARRPRPARPHHGPDPGRPVPSRRDHRRVPHRDVQILAVQDATAAELLLDLGKRPAAQQRLTIADPDGGRGLRRPQGAAVDQDPGIVHSRRDGPEPAGHLHEPRRPRRRTATPLTVSKATYFMPPSRDGI